MIPVCSFLKLVGAGVLEIPTSTKARCAVLPWCRWIAQDPIHMEGVSALPRSLWPSLEIYKNPTSMKKIREKLQKKHVMWCRHGRWRQSSNVHRWLWQHNSRNRCHGLSQHGRQYVRGYTLEFKSYITAHYFGCKMSLAKYSTSRLEKRKIKKQECNAMGCCSATQHIASCLLIKKYVNENRKRKK